MYEFFRDYLILFLLLFITSCNTEHLYKKTSILMDTVVSITVVSDSREKAESVIEEAFSEIKRLEGLINFYSDKSEISMINKNAGVKPVKVSHETLDVIKKAVYISEITDGAFDITVGPLVRLWDFHKKIKPDDIKIKEAKRHVGYRDIIIDEIDSTVYLRRKGMYIDPGGIVKGYTADIVVEILKRRGIKAGLVAVAGDIKAFGRKPDGSLWRVGVRNPRSKDSDDLIATIELNDKAISTSGDYERYFIIDGKRYHHILNPETGYPEDDSVSVTVISEDGFIADGLSTGFFVLGPEKSLRIAKRYNLGLIIVDKRLRIHTTENINGLKIRDVRINE